ncbi:MAG: PAS domain S-box protein [Actinomycetota bacterium]|nr:PAS domain S-box protein [Actinomycetota bacterium]
MTHLVDTAVFERVRDGIFVLDREWRFVFVNQAGALLVGRTAEELLGRTVWETFPETVDTTFERQYRAALSSQSFVEFEEYFGPTGRWYTFRVFPSPDGLTSYFLDSSAQHSSAMEMEALLRQAQRQKRLATVLAETNEAVFRAKSPTELFEAAVQIAVEHGGFVMSWLGVIDDRRGVVTAVASAGVAAEEYLIDNVISVREDRLGMGVGGMAIRSGVDVCSNDILLDENMAPWREAAVKVGYRSSGGFPLMVGGRVAGLMSVYSPEPGFFNEEERSLVRRLAANVSYGWESLEREAALRESEIARRTGQRFRAVLSAAPDAIVGVDPTGNIELVNVKAETLFGWKQDELLGRPVEMLIPAELGELHRQRRRSYLANPAIPIREGLQLSALRRDGSTFQAEIALSYVEDEESRALVLASVRDLTERLELEDERRQRALEAQREQADRLDSLGKLAGGVAHDFNNLLGVILNYSTLLERQLQEPRQRADIGEIRAAAQRGADLTRQLLTFARGDHANPEPVEVNSAIRSIGSLLERAVGASTELRIKLEPVPLVTLIDRQQLDQIIVNLAINANDAMPQGGTLTISTSLELADGEEADVEYGGKIAIEVADTGSGMPPEVVSRIFEPFFTTKPRGRGTGLGMAVVYGIINRSGGTISIDSEPGQGTNVKIELPLAGAGLEAAGPAAPPADQGAKGGPERILLVEDDPKLREATARIIEGAGYQVVAVGDGEEALEAIEAAANQFDLVLSDLVMPRMSGDELAERLGRRLPSLPVLLITGYDSGDAARREGVLLKPIDEQSLLTELRKVLDG